MIKTQIRGNIVYGVIYTTIKAIVVFEKVLQFWSRVGIFITTSHLIWGFSGPHNIITHALSATAVCFLPDVLIHTATACKIIGVHKTHKAVSIKVVNK